MKYTCSVTIGLPRDRVIELFDSTENLHKWQKGLKAFEHLEGTPGEAGAKSRMEYDMNGKTVEMVETVLHRGLPDELSFSYEAKNVWNSCINRFTELEDGKTHWEMETEFQFSGFMKIIGLLMPGAFRKQTLGDMNRFKEFAERA